MSSRSSEARLAGFFLAVTSIGWAINWAAIKILLREWPPLFSRGVSGVCAAVLLALGGVMTKSALPVTPTALVARQVGLDGADPGGCCLGAAQAEIRDAWRGMTERLLRRGVSTSRAVKVVDTCMFRLMALAIVMCRRPLITARRFLMAIAIAPSPHHRLMNKSVEPEQYSQAFMHRRRW